MDQKALRKDSWHWPDKDDYENSQDSTSHFRSLDTARERIAILEARLHDKEEIIALLRAKLEE